MRRVVSEKLNHISDVLAASVIGAQRRDDGGSKYLSNTGKLPRD
jgi:hypothetical protein